ncbi:MAG: PAS domain S-box protein [Lentisphaerae bacterium]|nr:PAS domain S-box protein [Lentisphaerota bacterium]
MTESDVRLEDMVREVDALHTQVTTLHERLAGDQAVDLDRLRDELGGLLSRCAKGLSGAGQSIGSELERRQESDAALRQERDRIRMYLDIIDSMIVVLDQDGCVAQINRAGCDVLVREESEVIGVNWVEHFVPEARRDQTRAIFDQLRAGNVAESERHENQVISRGRGERTVAWRNAVIRDETGAIIGTVGSGEDITDRRRMELALRESERMDAVGALAETVSQNFGNILTAIDGYASFLVDSLIPNTRAHQHAERIVDATRHAAELMRRLMHVAKASNVGAVAVETISLEDAVRRTLELMAHILIPRNVKAVVRTDVLPDVEADADQLIDVLMSIMTNSAEAMPQGGTIAIDTIERRISKPRMNPTAKGGVYVGLRIRDTGVGMSRSIMQRIFEPLFSTKESVESLGLGLPVAQSIVQSMGGWIDVHSREGTGTIFRVFLPKGLSERVEESKSTVSSLVLVADDSREDLLAMKTTVQEGGHRVVAVSDAAMALLSYRERRDELAVVVLDFMLPTAAGVALPEEIFAIDPQAPVIVTSGFSREYVRDRLSSSTWTFLQKPFTPEQFLACVTRVIAQRRES